MFYSVFAAQTQYSDHLVRGAHLGAVSRVHSMAHRQTYFAVGCGFLYPP